jgi:DNA-binding response OmpR family regulator
MTLRKPRILFLEDHEDTRALVKVVLRGSPYDLAMTATIAETLTLAKSEHFNLFMFDSWLSDGSGLDLCKEIRKFDHVTPILFYSGVGYEKDKQLALTSGAQAYLVKPVAIDQLLQTIKYLIEANGGLEMDEIETPKAELRKQLTANSR